VYFEWKRDAHFRTNFILASHGGDVKIALMMWIRHGIDPSCIDVDVIRSLCAMILFDNIVYADNDHAIGLFDVDVLCIYDGICLFGCVTSCFCAFVFEVIKRGDDAVACRAVMDAAVGRIRPEMDTCLFVQLAFEKAIVYKRRTIARMIKDHSLGSEHQRIAAAIKVEERREFVNALHHDTVRPFKNETTILRLRSYFFLMLS
jgi:hypothetical protein